MSDPATCKHDSTESKVVVHIITDEGGTPIGYMAHVRIRCARCKTFFKFLGLQHGVDTQGARVSLDDQEAMLAVIPDGLDADPARRRGYNVNSNEVH